MRYVLKYYLQITVCILTKETNRNVNLKFAKQRTQLTYFWSWKGGYESSLSAVSEDNSRTFHGSVSISIKLTLLVLVSFRA